ncbi:hypothetical protein GQ55_2G420900 [Panicum hallii var. hallii]|uniref:Uncharacterized protein n=1 Tax=Panicum hallii var. hallii TaxID=1504633 RepID=A0A2T7EY63_9POAL|nr:hypothetical protein GQ55_2G420900 [Panicum hallii var. hallii]
MILRVGPWAALGTAKAGHHCTQRARPRTRPTHTTHAFSSLVMGHDFFGLHCLARAMWAVGPAIQILPAAQKILHIFQIFEIRTVFFHF